MDLCRKCDVFIGHAGAGVARKPENMTEEQLAECCWICKRPREEIREAGDLREV